MGVSIVLYMNYNALATDPFLSAAWTAGQGNASTASAESQHFKLKKHRNHEKHKSTANERASIYKDPKHYSKPRQTVQSPQKTLQRHRIVDQTQNIRQGLEIFNKSSNKYEFNI